MRVFHAPPLSLFASAVALMSWQQVTSDKQRAITQPAAGSHSVVAYGRDVKPNSTFAYSEFAVYDKLQVSW